MKYMAEKEIGKVSSYFSHVSVAAIKLTGKLKVGDKIHIKGHTTDFETKIKGISGCSFCAISNAEIPSNDGRE